MMKKVLLTALTGMMAYGAMAQVCTPDPTFNPSSPIGGIQDLPCAKQNQPYNEASTIVVPTVYQISGQTAYICKVRVDSVNNFPANSSLNYAVWYNGVSYGPGQWINLNTANSTDRACVRVNGTFTALYNDSLGVFARVAAYGNQSCTIPLLELPVTQLNNGQPIKVGFIVDDDCVMGLDNLSNNSFDVAQNFPNPFSGTSQIAFNLPQAGKVVYRLTNLVGKTVAETNINGNVGANYININSADYAAGVYMYSVSFNGQTVTKRLIIK